MQPFLIVRLYSILYMVQEGAFYNTWLYHESASNFLVLLGRYYFSISTFLFLPWIWKSFHPLTLSMAVWLSLLKGMWKVPPGWKLVTAINMWPHSYADAPSVTVFADLVFSEEIRLNGSLWWGPYQTRLWLYKWKFPSLLHLLCRDTARGWVFCKAGRRSSFRTRPFWPASRTVGENKNQNTLPVLSNPVLAFCMSSQVNYIAVFSFDELWRYLLT